MSEPRACKEAGRLPAHLQGVLDESEEARLVAHLDTCALCQQTLEQLAAGDMGLLETARQVKDDPPPVDPHLSHLLDRLGRRAQLEPPPDERATSGSLDAIDFLDPPRNPAHLGRLGDYEVIELIARGGMGIVLKAIDEKLGRVVCLKVLTPQIAASETARRRFVREAQAAAAIRCPQVVAIYAVAEARGLPFLVMEFVEGPTLQQRLDSSRPLAVDEIARIGVDVATALAAAHARSLVHRDVKPGNILLDEGSGLARLTDFGLARAADDARLTREGILAGTPEYMSPEQARGEPLDHRSDLFSLGSVLYTMCTGQSPFQAGSSLACVTRLCEATPQPIAELNPDVPRWLEDVVVKLHARSPADRFQTATDVVAVLHDEGCPKSQATVRLANPPKVRAPRRRVWQPMLAGALLLGVGAIVAAQIVIRVRNRDGQTTEVTAPAGASVEVTKDGKVVASDAEESGGASGSMRRYAGHEGSVVGVAFLPGDKQFISAGHDGTLRVWDVESGEIRRTWKAHDGEIYRLAVSRDGRRALTASRDNTARLWDVESGRELRRFQQEECAAFCVALSPDGRQAVIGGVSRAAGNEAVDQASATGDGRMWLWDAEDGRAIGRFDGHEKGVIAVAISADGRRVLSGSQDFTMRLWDVTSRKELKRFEGHETWVWSVALSPDGRIAASGSGTHNVDAARGRPGDCFVRVWDVESGRELRRFESFREVVTLCFVSGGRRILFGGAEAKLRLGDTENGRELHRFAGHRGVVQSVAVSSDGRRAVSASLDGTLRLWELPQAPGLQK